MYPLPPCCFHSLRLGPCALPANSTFTQRQCAPAHSTTPTPTHAADAHAHANSPNHTLPKMHARTRMLRGCARLGSNILDFFMPAGAVCGAQPRLQQPVPRHGAALHGLLLPCGAGPARGQGAGAAGGWGKGGGGWMGLVGVAVMGMGVGTEAAASRGSRWVVLGRPWWRRWRAWACALSCPLRHAAGRWTCQRSGQAFGLQVGGFVSRVCVWGGGGGDAMMRVAITRAKGHVNAADDGDAKAVWGDGGGRGPWADKVWRGAGLHAA